MSKRIHSLEGREEHVRELGNAAHGKQELTCWRGGRGRSRLASSEMWHIANKGLTCWRGGRGRSRLASSEMWHVAKWGLTCWRGGRGRSGLVSLEMWHIANED